MQISAENITRKEKILRAGAILALGSFAYRSWKHSNENLTFDFTIVGEKTKLLLASLIDESKEISGRITAILTLGDDQKLLAVETDNGEPVTPQQLDAFENALAEKKGWPGQKPDENPLQTG